MKRHSVLALGVAVLLAAACKKGPPSRADVADLLKPQLAAQPWTQELSMGFLSADRAGKEALAHGTICDWTKPKAIVEALESGGYYTRAQFQMTINPGFWCGTETAFIWLAAPTEKGRGLLSVPNERPDLRRKIPSATVAAATAELVEISGVTAPTEGLPPGPMVTAQFSYKWVLTPLAHSIQPLLAKLPSDELKSGQAVLVRYDDGWRVESLNL